MVIDISFELTNVSVFLQGGGAVTKPIAWLCRRCQRDYARRRIRPLDPAVQLDAPFREAVALLFEEVSDGGRLAAIAQVTCPPEIHHSLISWAPPS
jgi:hypothetical protein